MLKKIISALTAITMMLSVLSGVIAFAEEEGKAELKLGDYISF